MRESDWIKQGSRAPVPSAESLGRGHPCVSAVTRLCEEHLPGKYQIEVVDLLAHPQLARGDQIVSGRLYWDQMAAMSQLGLLEQ